MKKIVVEDYNPKWVHAFNELKAAYLEHIRCDLRIEHIGSTAIIGLASKPIIDIDIVVKNQGELLDLVVQLEELGYIYLGDLGVTGREAFKRSLQEVPLLYEHHSKWFAHHLFVVLEDSLPFKNHMALKDYLKTHRDTVYEYAELKKALAHKYPHDKIKYNQEKTPFITHILSKCDFSQEEINEIKKNNAS